MSMSVRGYRSPGRLPAPRCCQAALDVGHAAVAELARRNAGALQDGRGHLVALGVDACRIERVYTAADAQEARGVEICLGS